VPCLVTVGLSKGVGFSWVPVGLFFCVFFSLPCLKAGFVVSNITPCILCIMGITFMKLVLYMMRVSGVLN